MTIKEAIDIHLMLTSQRQPDGYIYESSLVLALKKSRIITARDENTGIPDPNAKCGSTGNWIGAMGYITILDQIGDCYHPSTKTKITSNISGIKKALSYYTSFTSQEINAIYALRNAFFHDFSLLNMYPGYFHRFKVDDHPTKPVVILPAQPWNGQINSFNNNNETYINLKKLGDLGEEIYKNLISFNSQGQLILDLPGGTAELLARYIIIHK